MKKYLSVYLFAMLALISPGAMAHLKWFTANAEPIDLVDYYSGFQFEIVIGAILFFSFIAFVLWLQQRVTIDALPNPGKALVDRMARLFSILIGISLLYTSYSESIIAAHYVVSNQTMVILQYAQAIAGFLLLFNVYPKLAAIVLLTIYVVLAAQFGLVEVLDYLNVIGIALFLALYYHANRDMQDAAIPVLRIVTGITLAVLAFSEKFLNPGLGLNFLAVNEWNFMSAVGLPFSNELFVLSAGYVELLIGVLLIFGIFTRTTTLVLVAFMVTSNVTFVVQDSDAQALTELAGHLPVLAIALMLLMSGRRVVEVARAEKLAVPA